MDFSNNLESTVMYKTLSILKGSIYFSKPRFHVLPTALAGRFEGGHSRHVTSFLWESTATIISSMLTASFSSSG